MENPEDRRARLHNKKSRKREPRELKAQQRAFRKAQKVRVPKSIKPEFEQISKITEEISETERHIQDIERTRKYMDERKTDLQTKITELQGYLQKLETERADAFQREEGLLKLLRDNLARDRKKFADIVGELLKEEEEEDASEQPGIPAAN